MAQWIEAEVKKDWKEAEVNYYYPDQVQVVDGVEYKISPLVTVQLGPQDPKKRTLLVYAHYDVQPAEKADGWDTDPWKLVRLDNGEMRGRGSSDDKGPLVGWLCTLKAYKESGVEVPINVKFCCEGFEESASLGFNETLRDHIKHTGFLDDVDFVCISDNYWVTTSKPCLTHGLRGLLSVQLAIKGPKRDLHSGLFGGQVYQPMDDLIYLFSQLKDGDDNILIPGVMDDVMAITDEERALYEKLEFSIKDKKDEIGTTRLRDEENRTKCVMNVWRLPSLTVHGIEGAFSEPGFKTVIPMRVVGKFSIRLVPNQDPATIQKLVTEYVEKKFAERKSPNEISIHSEIGRWWYTEPKNAVFEAGKKAIEKVWGVTPDFSREGGSIPITLTLGEQTGAPVCLLPMGRSDDSPHSQNEKLDLSNYHNGMKVFASFLDELSTAQL
eukprot:Protomagalhaensia_sp_Gyna_25__5339@NODE_675_length_2861_cov_1823_365344_g526_i0_p1_GENE_NODE_675_length_2861_cov_1823_365344_g526_i0NODE_675_length_2861_cov_1823_365344_g526_i0_p1_ORF_typecomplete_len505_score88_50Peptidase_M20/PF01546_28/6_7e43M20_dimer/PF07687_14/1_4e20Peptidase_M28/PF04389_17/0_0059_NODE_675_length_2861_cov_1823_365344_g526_i013452661